MTSALPLTVAAPEATKITGYKTVRRFTLAVARGVFPPPIDPKARPQRWSRAALEEMMRSRSDAPKNDGASSLDRALGLA